MKYFLSTVLLFCVSVWQVVFAQTSSIDRVQFLNDTSTLNATIIINAGKLFSRNKRGSILTANFVTKLPDGTNVNDQIQLEVRGHYRHDYCYLPPLKLIFKYKKPSILYSLKSLKLVNQCKLSKEYDQYLLKEFIIYRIYNLLTDMSYHVRLLNLNFQDSSGKKKTITEHAFLVEDIKDVAKRNDCIEWKKGNLDAETTDRRQMTMVAIFEYMIGNTDWGVAANHNTRMIVPEKNSFARPFVVPYDFDFSGFVNTEYALPDEKLGIQNVQQRLYRGFPRTMPELNEVLDIFKQQKEKIYATINNFDLLTPGSKKDLITYLDDFFNTIKDSRQVKSVFIDNARTE
jgi:hypothetical protein